MIKVSILIPVYNVEKYLKQCLCSVVNQTLKEIEIICVDDGSTDSSGQILDDYAQKDSRIKVLHKENSGYGDSLNRALETAQGEYIGILESDDFAEPDMYEFLYQIAVSESLDCVKSNYYRYSEEGRVYHEALRNCDYGVVFSADENMEKFFTGAINIWAGIYRREFLLKNDIRFLCTPGASYQDLSFWFKVYVSAERSCFTKRAFINYRVDNSASSVKSKDKVFFICDEVAECKKYLYRTNRSLDVFYPRLIKIMYAVYRWNANRIAVSHLKEFMNRIVPEMKEDKQGRYMDRTIFEDWQWEEFRCMVELSDAFIRMQYIQRGNELCENNKVYGQMIVKYLCDRDIYIYGAGKYGKRLKHLLRQNGYNREIRYLVSGIDDCKKEGNVTCITDASLDKQKVVVVAVADVVKKVDMLEKAREQGFQQVFAIDDVIRNLFEK